MKKNNIRNIIDGYGLMPLSKYNLNFIRQLFYKEIFLPFGIQSTQVHLNYWNERDFEKFQNFIEKNRSKIISFDEAINKINNNSFFLSINFIIEKALKLVRNF